MNGIVVAELSIKEGFVVSVDKLRGKDDEWLGAKRIWVEV